MCMNRSRKPSPGLALDELRVQATADKAKEWCARLCETFTALTRRQPVAYQVDHLLHLEREQLRNRLGKVIAQEWRCPGRSKNLGYDHELVGRALVTSPSRRQFTSTVISKRRLAS